MVEIVEYREGRAGVCQAVLDDLPEWFGIPESKADYVASSAELPMFVAYVGGEAAGFISLKRQTEFAAELYVLGLKRRFHRQGLGRSLIEATARFAKNAGFSFLTVKTLAPDHPDLHYAATRKFYEAVGFVPIEVFPPLWHPETPCLLMLKPLAR